MPDLIYYCFGYTTEDILKDLEQDERSLIIEKIINEKRPGGCDCAKKNLKGR